MRTGGIPIRPLRCAKWTVVSRAAARGQRPSFPQLIPFASEVALMRELLSEIAISGNDISNLRVYI